jgi:hypothetical protein
MAERGGVPNDVRRFMRMTIGAALLIGVAVSSVRADVNSGPTVGERPPALKVLALTGDEEYQELDYREERKEKPTVYVFVRADRFDRPVCAACSRRHRHVRR